MALHLVDTSRLIRRDTWQVIVYRLTSDEEEAAGAIWTSQYFTSVRAASQHAARLRRLFRDLHLWELFRAQYGMSVVPNQQNRV